MKVVKHELKPPTPTYDIIGLTEEEAQCLINLLATQPAVGLAYDIYSQLYDATGLRWKRTNKC